MTLQELSSKRQYCGACKGTQFEDWLDLGMQPLANNLVRSNKGTEQTFPLKVVYCKNCELVQLADIVNPDLLFKKYLYYSSTSPVFVEHFERLAIQEMLYDRVHKKDLVVDIGSNDGILLKPFQDRGASVMGVEPAENIATAASKNGIPTMAEYFNVRVASEILKKYGEAKLITATNVFAHVNDLDEILDGVKALLHKDGRFMIEVAYLPEMLEAGTFDLIYHEHLFYWHLYPLTALLFRKRFYIDEVQYISTHGGSIRVFIKPGEEKKLNTNTYDRGLTGKKLFKAFPSWTLENKAEIMDALLKIKAKKLTVAGYGAPAKMSTMSNYFGMDDQVISFVMDDSPHKDGFFSPKSHLKIMKYDKGLLPYIDYIFIFAWNFKKSIIDKVRADGYRGKFITPFPTVNIT